MTVLTNHRRERFVHGLISGETARAAYISAGYSERGAAQSAQRLLKKSEIRSRKAELEERVAFTFVAGQIADRQYRMALYQDVAERLQRLIAARAEASKGAKIPGVDTGLLVGARKSLRQGKKTIIVSEYQTDSVVLKTLLDVTKQAALETGDWQEKQAHRPEKPGHADLRGMTAEELCIERDILLRAQAEAKARIEALRASKQIEAAPGTVEEVRGDQPPAWQHPTY